MKKVIVVSWEKAASLSEAELIELTEKMNGKLHAPADFMDPEPARDGSREDLGLRTEL